MVRFEIGVTTILTGTNLDRDKTQTLYKKAQVVYNMCYEYACEN